MTATPTIGGHIPELRGEGPIHGDGVRMPGHSFMLLSYDAERGQIWTMEGNFNRSGRSRCPHREAELAGGPLARPSHSAESVPHLPEIGRLRYPKVTRSDNFRSVAVTTR